MRTFRDALRGKTFTVTADLSLDRGTDAGAVREQARLLGPLVDAMQVPDAHDGRVQMSGQAAAAILLDEGVDPVVQITGRDRNRIALENDLLGLGVLGVSSVLLTRGEELPSAYKPSTRQVLEMSGEDLVTMARLMGDDESIPGAPGFCIGTAATVFAPKKSWQPRSLVARADAGAAFIQTQVCYNMKALRRYMDHLVEARLPWRCAIIVGLAVLPDAAAAALLRQSLHGTVMPEKVERRIAQAADSEAEGVHICVEKIEKLRAMPGVSGIALSSPGRPELVAEVLRASGLAR